MHWFPFLLSFVAYYSNNQQDVGFLVSGLVVQVYREGLDRDIVGLEGLCKAVCACGWIVGRRDVVSQKGSFVIVKGSCIHCFISGHP